MKKPVPKLTQHIWIIVLAVFLAVIATSCASVSERIPRSEELSRIAQIPGIPRARTWGDAEPPFAKEWPTLKKAELETKFPGIMRTQHNYLAISGGGQNGAFAAGLLVGWSKAGDRPEFTLVTGVSTGALIAPFIFLGPDWDDKLKQVYTTISEEDIFNKRGLLRAVLSDAAANTEPLQALIAKYFDKEVMKKIAAEHRKGRRLFVGTTNLDAGRPVIWSISAIADSGHPKALELVRKVLLASASIPGAFPPVYIEVEANGHRFKEMHVDGGTASQVFLYPSQLDWTIVLDKLEAKERPHVYVIRNSFIEPDLKTVEPKFLSIASRSIESLIRTQGIGDLYKLYADARRDGLDFHLAYIPDSFEMKPKGTFDQAYMKQLYELGYNMAKNGYPWEKAPPGFELD
jgi:predicted acylesterase/phospholipase RssA